MMFKAINGELSIFGKTLSEIQQKWLDFLEDFKKNGIHSLKGISILRKSNLKPLIIPESELIKELTFDEAKQQLEDFNKCVIDGGQNLEDYFTGAKAGNTVLKNYVTTTEKQMQSTQGLIEASKQARAAQIAQNEAIKASTLSAKASKLALQALATVGNMFVGWAISKIISAVVTGIDKLSNSAKYAQEAVDDLMDSFNSALSTANSNLETFDKLSSRYKELSGGVNKLGQNVALTSEEYAEYNDIVNQIAEMSPTLVAGYTAEGNAILTVSGNVAELRENLESARDSAYEMLLATDAVFKNLANQSETGGFAKFFDGWNWSKLLPGGDFISRLEDIFNWDNIEVGKGISTEDAMKELEDFQKLTAEQFKELQNWNLTKGSFDKSKTITNADGTTSEFTEYILDAMGLGYNFTEEDFALAKKQASILVKQLQGSYDEVIQSVRKTLNASLILSDNYDALSQNEDIATFASLLVNSIDSEMAHEFDNDSAKANQWVESLVDGLIASGSEVNIPLNSLLNLDIESLSENMNPDELKKYVDGFVQQIVTVLTNAGVEIDASPIIAGLDIQSVYDNASQYLDLQVEFHKLISDDYFDKIESGLGEEIAHEQYSALLDWFYSLSPEDMELAYRIVVDSEAGTMEVGNFQTKLEELKVTAQTLKTIKPLSGLSEWLDAESNSEKLEKVKSDIDTLRSAYEELGNADLTQSGLDTLLFELLQQFPQLAKYTDGTLESVERLREAIAQLGKTEATELVETLQNLANVEGITESARQELERFVDTLTSLSDISINIEMEDTKDVIRTMRRELEELAGLKKVISDENGTVLDFEEAKEYLDLFPELLQGAEMCADGTVKLNSDVANEFINSREAEIRADGEARITELENAKAIYESRKAFAEAELAIVTAALEAESTADMEAAIDKIENIESARNASVQAGIDEITANTEATRAMGGNAEDLTNYIADVAKITRDNVDTASVDSANSVQKNATNMQTSILEIGKKANEANLAIAAIGTGKTIPLSRVNSIGGTSGSKSFQNIQNALGISTTFRDGLNGNFANIPLTEKVLEEKGLLELAKSLKIDTSKNTTTLIDIMSASLRNQIQESDLASKLEDLKSDLSVDIAGYDEAIKLIDQQIAMIKANAGVSLDDYVAGIINSESDKKSKEASEKVFDWIEVLIKNVERELQRLETIANSTYTNWTERNSALASQMAKTREEIGLQQAAYLAYMKKAESVGLPDYWKNLAKNGALDISTITDENLAEQISSYQEYIDKANAAQDAVYELNETLSSLYQTSFDNVVAQYESILAVVENHQSILEEKLSQAEEKGYIVSVKYYEALMKTERENIIQLEKEKNALISSLNEAVNSGQIDKGSEAFMDMQAQIDDVTLSLEQANTAMIQYQNSIRDIEWETFDLLQSRIEKVTSEADFLIDLMSSGDLYDESGKLNDKGMATAGLHGTNYNVYMEQARKYAEEIQKLNKEISEDPYDQDLINRRYELIELQQESILAAESEKQAIIDLVNEGIQAELDALKELIDAYNESLDSQKELYDYQKSVSKQTREIVSLQKQLAAYQGDNSEEGRKKLQEIQTSLTEAQENLEETEYEKYISDQKTLLDEFYAEYELILNQRLDNIDVLLEEVIGEINSNSSAINDTITSVADSVGYTLSNEMSSIWESNTSNISSIITTYGENTSANFTSVINVLNSINSEIQSMIEQMNSDADTKVDSATSSLGGSSGSTSGSTSTVTPSTTPSGSAGNNTSSNGSSGNASASDSGSFFLYKKDTYPKEKLNKDTSIVDRLKFFNFDSSFDARKLYYNKMGFSGTYISNAKQNTDMIRWMKAKGYAKGVYNLPKSEVAWTQEDGREVIISPSTGAMLTPLAEHDSVLNAAATRNMFEFFNDPAVFMEGLRLGKYSLDPSATAKMNQNIENNFQVEIVVNNPDNYDDFVYQLQHDKNFEKMLQAMTIGKLSGGGDLRKFRW